MKTNSRLIFLALSTAILIPFPGRLGYGIILLLALNLMTLIAAASRVLIVKISLKELQHVIVPVMLITSALVFRNLLVMISPVIALTLSFGFFLTAVSSFFVSSFFIPDMENFSSELKTGIKSTLVFSAYALFIFAFRDIAGYGTLTVPSTEGLRSVLILQESRGFTSLGLFFNTIPGAIVIIAVTQVIYSIILDNYRKIDIEESADVR